MRARVCVVGAVLGALLLSTLGTAPLALAGGDPNGSSSSAVHRSVVVLPASNHVTGKYPTSCHARGKLPDPACTPGAVSDAVHQSNIHSTVCVKGWTAKIRPPQSETGPVKREAMKAYGIPASKIGTTELDHEIPLVLGGSSDVRNLWAEASDLPGQGFRNSKDDVEVKLAVALCKAGSKLQLTDLQNWIAADWTTALHKAGLA